MGMVLRIVFAFRVLIFFLGGREQLVENTGQEFFAQHRTVGDKAIGVVDKRYAVDSPCGIDPENSVDTVHLQQLPELVRVLCGLMASLTVWRKWSSAPGSFSLSFDFA